MQPLGPWFARYSGKSVINLHLKKNVVRCGWSRAPYAFLNVQNGGVGMGGGGRAQKWSCGIRSPPKQLPTHLLAELRCQSWYFTNWNEHLNIISVMMNFIKQQRTSFWTLYTAYGFQLKEMHYLQGSTLWLPGPSILSSMFCLLSKKLLQFYRLVGGPRI